MAAVNPRDQPGGVGTLCHSVWILGANADHLISFRKKINKHNRIIDGSGQEFSDFKIKRVSGWFDVRDSRT